MYLKKYIVLGILFVLPMIVYIFFASGVHNFKTLPVLTTDIPELSQLKFTQTQLEDHITILGFLGDNPEDRALSIFNVNEKIYRRFYEFEDFQFVMVGTHKSKNDTQKLTSKINQQMGTDASKWHFVFGDPTAINILFRSLQSPYELDEHLGSDKMFIIDKQRQLRGRDDENKKVYGYNTRSIADINNEMVDDVKILLAEYRLELKKNGKSRRQKYLLKSS